VNALEACPVCGFTFTDRTVDGARASIRSSTASWQQLLGGGGELEVRPQPDRWSALEEAAHVRDVLLAIRERCVLACALEDGVGQPIHRDERMAVGLGVCGDASEVAVDLGAAASLLDCTLAKMTPAQHERSIRYSPVAPVTASVTWMANQAAHESAHHLGDVREDSSVKRPGRAAN
jgi:hypothetical protein